jgi:hypothetical protein
VQANVVARVTTAITTTSVICGSAIVIARLTKVRSLSRNKCLLLSGKRRCDWCTRKMQVNEIE